MILPIPFKINLLLKYHVKNIIVENVVPATVIYSLKYSYV